MSALGDAGGTLVEPRSVVIVGAGHAGVQLCSQLRAEGFDGRIDLISSEPSLPYHRPPLSKVFLTADTAPTLLRPAEFYRSRAIELTLSTEVERIDRSRRRVLLSDGTTRAYDRLVLATGARNRTLPVEGDPRHVHTVRTIADAGGLRSRLRDVDHIAIVGGGFIGLEIAAIGRKLGKRVTVIEAQDRIMARAVSPAVSSHFMDLHQAQGVEVILQAQLSQVIGHESSVTLKMLDGRLIEAEALVAGIGVIAEDRLAREAGLETGYGIIVDDTLRTADPAIYAIGDCARFQCAATGAAVRLECVQNAVDQAAHVAAQITKGPSRYVRSPWFWSDQYATRLQIAGTRADVTRDVLRSVAETGGFTLFAFSSDRLVCAESVDRPADHVLARRVLDQGLPFTPEQAADPSFDLRRMASDTAKEIA